MCEENKRIMSKHSLPADGAGLSSLNLSLDGRSIKATPPSTVGAASSDINHKKPASSVVATDRRSNSSYLDHSKATNKIVKKIMFFFFYFKSLIFIDNYFLI